MSKPLQNQQPAGLPAHADSNTNQSAHQGSTPAMAQLAETVARVQARLNNPKAEKSSFRHEPVRLMPAPAEKTSASSGLPGLPPRQEARPDGASSPSVRSGSSTVAQAKNYLRATRSPKFLRPNRSLERHARKCAICRHPEREMIEELFVRWHSPEAIANFLDDHDQINWVSIYRHAYALGLDAVRRRNLGYVFENILDNAADATPTAAGVVAAARAISCIGEDGRWVEPEKRILITTLVRKEDSSAVSSTDPDNSASSSEGPTEFSSSLPKAAIDNERASSADALCGSGLQPRQKMRRSCAPYRERPESRGSASTPPRLPAVAGATSRSRLPAEESVPAPSSSLPKAVADNEGTSPDDALCGSGLQPRQNAPSRESHLLRASFAQGGRSNPQGTAAHPTPLAAGSREIRLPLNSHRTKDKPISNR